MKSIKTWLFLGIFIRLILMPFLGHWDLTSLHQVAESLFTNGKDAAYAHYFSIYPPLTYIFLGFWQKVISWLIFPDFRAFLNDPNMISFINPHAFRYLFLLKLPYLFFDILIGFMLRAMVHGENDKSKIFKLWMLNPVTLYATYSWGAIDIIPAFFVVLALYSAFKKHPLISALCLGIGGSFKAYPLLLLLPFSLIYYHPFKDRIKAVFFGLLPFVLTTLPFLSSRNFLVHFFSSDQLQMLQHASFYIGREQYVSVFYILYTVLLIFLYKSKITYKLLPWFFFVIIFTFYGISAFTPQWFVWGLPFFFLVAVENKLSGKWYGLILILYFTLVLLFEVTLNLGLFAPLDPTLLEYPAVNEKIAIITDPNRINSIIRSIFLGITLYLFYLTRPRNLYD